MDPNIEKQLAKDLGLSNRFITMVTASDNVHASSASKAAAHAKKKRKMASTSRKRNRKK